MAWPLQSQCDAFYGNPRSNRAGVPSAAWERENLVYIKPPFEIQFLGKPAKMRVHRKCAPAFMEWLDAVWKNAGRDQRVIRQWGMDVYGRLRPQPTQFGGRNPCFRDSSSVKHQIALR
jgi:hypothetical protein